MCLHSCHENGATRPARQTPPHTAQQRRCSLSTASLPPLTRVGVRRVNPPLTLATAGTVDTGRYRESVGVVRLVAKADAVLVEPPERLLKQRRLGVACRHGTLDDVQLVFVHVDSGERSGLIGVVRDLDLMSFH